jgi:hypothetical protein
MLMSHAPRPKRIDRIENPSEEYFRKNYVEKGIPVVVVNNRPRLAQHQWDFEYLKKTVGDRVVPVYDWGHEGPTVNDHFEITQMTMAQAIQECTKVKSTAGQRYSVCQLSINQYLPELAEQYQLPPVLEHALELDRLPEPFSETDRRALFISFFRGIHWHNGREVLAQLINGRKKFILYHPRDSRYLYPRKLLRSGLAWFDENEAVFCSDIPFEDGVDSIDRERFPLFERAIPLEVDLEAGESLFIPSHWWHFTTAHVPCVLVAHFWDSPIRRWGYPIGWRSLIMKPYRKYLYQRVLTWKKEYSRNSKIKNSVGL